MQLNLKDPETNAMVERLSVVTGVTKARAVKDAVRDKLARIDEDREADIARRLAELRRLTADIRSRLPQPLPSQEEFDAWMYDEHGLPH